MHVYGNDIFFLKDVVDSINLVPHMYVRTDHLPSDTINVTAYTYQHYTVDGVLSATCYSKLRNAIIVYRGCIFFD